MNAQQMKSLRDSYNVEAVRPDGRKSTTAEYIRYITDCGVEYVSSKDLIVPDDANSILHCICNNEDAFSQANYPVKVISTAYEDIHAVEAIMSKENFRKFLETGFIKTLSKEKKDFILKWLDSDKMAIQAQQEPRKYPCYGNEGFTVIPSAKIPNSKYPDPEPETPPAPPKEPSPAGPGAQEVDPKV